MTSVHGFVYVVAFDGQRFVMVSHRKRGWEMPGGHVEEDEIPADAATREFMSDSIFKNSRRCLRSRLCCRAKAAAVLRNASSRPAEL